MTPLAPYRQFFLLAPQPGWRATMQGLTADDNGAFSLDPLPGAAAPIAAFAAMAEKYPVAIAALPGGPLHILCAGDERIHVAACGCETHPHILPGIGGEGHGARQFHHAQDIALLANGEIAVADYGNGAVKIFSPWPFALLAVWTGLGRPARIAAAHEGLWVLDAEGGRIIRVDNDGVVRETVQGLTAPVAFAAVGETIVVLDGTTILVYATPADAPVALGIVPDGMSLCIGPQNFIYVGTSTGLVHTFAADVDTGWRMAGVGVLGQRAPVHRLLWSGGNLLTALVTPEEGTQSQIWQIDTQAARVRMASLAGDELDSHVANCVWHRIALDADIPAGTSIKVTAEVYDQSGGASPPDLVAAPITLSGNQRDCLVQKGTGRYLKFQLQISGNGTATPVLRGIRIWFPRDGWLNSLPAVYQEDPESSAFLDRFLSILQTSYDSFDETIDDIWKMFDARSVPSDWFAWLAAWIAMPINPHWTDAQRRGVLRNAFQNYQHRGTPVGLEQLVSDYAGVNARLVEHFRLRQWIKLSSDPSTAVATGAGRLWSRDAYRRWQVGFYSQVGMFKLADSPEPAMEPLAWGANEFSVFFDASPLTVATTRKDVVAVVEREKPAHTQAHYRPVYARMRVGVQATLGVDTRVADAGQTVLGVVSTLGYDAILACSARRDGMPTPSQMTRPRLGVDTRLS
jgi:phage tail-like protein